MALIIEIGLHVGWKKDRLHFIFSGTSTVKCQSKHQLVQSLAAAQLLRTVFVIGAG